MKTFSEFYEDIYLTETIKVNKLPGEESGFEISVHTNRKQGIQPIKIGEVIPHEGGYKFKNDQLKHPHTGKKYSIDSNLVNSISKNKSAEQSITDNLNGSGRFKKYLHALGISEETLLEMVIDVSIKLCEDKDYEKESRKHLAYAKGASNPKEKARNMFMHHDKLAVHSYKNNDEKGFVTHSRQAKEYLKVMENPFYKVSVFENTDDEEAANLKKNSTEISKRYIDSVKTIDDKNIAKKKKETKDFESLFPL